MLLHEKNVRMNPNFWHNKLTKGSKQIYNVHCMKESDPIKASKGRLF